MFDFLPVLLEDRKQRVSTVHTETIEVEKYEQQICCNFSAACGPGKITANLCYKSKVTYNIHHFHLRVRDEVQKGSRLEQQVDEPGSVTSWHQ
jgi:hypothetical protein